MKTQAAILCAIDHPLEIWELEIPKLGPGQVLVEMAFSGICRTQLNEIKGYKGPDAYLPHTLGHEGSGIVREIGEGVSKVNIGDHVVLSWIKGQGIEAGGCKYSSKKGLVNSGPISTFLQIAIISENRVIPIPKELPLRDAALLGCAIPTGAGMIFNQLQVAKDSSCAIFGVGGIGLSAVLAAKFLEASQIIAVDVSDEKLAQAKQLGATHLINSKSENPIARIKEITNGKGAKGVLECVGRVETMEMAFQSASIDGLCVIAGNLPKGQKIQIDPFDLISGKKIIGSWGGATKIDQDIPRYVKMVLDKNVKVAPLITHEIPLDQINPAFQLLEEGKLGRAIINFNS